jgi:hypothetical protein
MYLLAACSGTYFWRETITKATKIREGVRVPSKNGKDPRSEVPPTQPLFHHPNLSIANPTRPHAFPAIRRSIPSKMK